MHWWKNLQNTGCRWYWRLLLIIWYFITGSEFVSEVTNDNDISSQFVSGVYDDNDQGWSENYEAWAVQKNKALYLKKKNGPYFDPHSIEILGLSRMLPTVIKQYWGNIYPKLQIWLCGHITLVRDYLGRLVDDNAHKS